MKLFVQICSHSIKLRYSENTFFVFFIEVFWMITTILYMFHLKYIACEVFERLVKYMLNIIYIS